MSNHSALYQPVLSVPFSSQEKLLKSKGVMIHDSSKGLALISQLYHNCHVFLLSSLALDLIVPCIIITFLNLVLTSLQSASLYDPCPTVPRTTARLALGLKQFLVVHVPMLIRFDDNWQDLG